MSGEGKIAKEKERDWSNCSWEKTQLFLFLRWNSGLKYFPQERLWPITVGIAFAAKCNASWDRPNVPRGRFLGLNSTTVFSRGSNSISCKLLLKTRPHQSKDIYGSVPCDVQSSAWFLNCHVCLTCMFLNLCLLDMYVP